MQLRGVGLLLALVTLTAGDAVAQISVRRDNQFGEGNAYLINPAGAIANPALKREFGYSLLP